jgi:hypothetical protein
MMTIDRICRSLAKALWLHDVAPGCEFGMYPWCAKCRQPVERMSMIPDVRNDQHYVLTCHGQTEAFTLTVLQIMTMKPGSLKFGWAFQEPERRE